MSDTVIKARNVQLVDKTSLGDTTRDDGPESRDAKADQARKQAYDQGFAAGLALQQENSLTTLKALSQILREAGDLKKKVWADSEEQMLKLVLAVAQKVIYDEVSTNSQIILGVLRAAVKGVLDREGMKIHLNPQDLLFLKEADLLQEFSGGRNVAFEEDGGIKRGGALLETIAGDVDARLEQRFQEVTGALKIR